MLSFASAPGNLFDRIGSVGGAIAQARTAQAAMQTILINTTTGIVAQYNGEPDIQARVGTSYISLLNNIGSPFGSLAQQMVRDTINRMVYRDNPRISQTLESMNVVDSINEVIRQMKVAGATIRAQTVTAVAAAFTGTGNGVINTSTRRPFDGLVLENMFAETLLATCTVDSYTGNATEGNETIQIQGVGSQSNLFAFDWPLGSNASVSYSAINGSQDNSSGNLLTNSGFDDFTSNAPDNWALEVGTAGVDFFSETTLTFDPPPNKALRILGDGSTRVALSQQFDNSAGTAGELDSLTEYGVCVWMRRDGTAPAAGVLTVELVDATGLSANTIADEQSIANSFTIDLTALSTQYAAFRGQFRMPRILPANQYLRLRCSTALTSGRSVYVDKISFGKMQQLYRHGPFLSVHAGSVPFKQNDFATVAVTNGRGSGGTLDTFHTLLYRTLPEVVTNEFLFPSSTVPSVQDLLIG